MSSMGAKSIICEINSDRFLLTVVVQIIPFFQSLLEIKRAAPVEVERDRFFPSEDDLLVGTAVGDVILVRHRLVRPALQVIRLRTLQKINLP